MTLNLFAFFHLNMMFSSIGEERRPEIVEKAYWPLLRLPQRIGAPIGVEATGLTLEFIRDIDPAWIAALRSAMEAGEIELIGSGYAQIIGPLAASVVNAHNLRLGSMAYREILGRTPKLALVNEQAYSGGMVSHYLDAGYGGILMDWDNLTSFHPDWPAETRFRPRLAKGACGRAIPLLWTQTMAFQRLQRFAHGDIGMDEYLETIVRFRDARSRTLCLYSNDAEVFDVRPGRLHTEEMVAAGEWDRIGGAWAALARMDGMNWIAPSQALVTLNPDARPLTLETPAYPLPVKKQPKYNISRWAVSGRDNLAINAACTRIAAALNERPDATDADWRAVCRLWSSDFRTHIGEARWRAFQGELGAWQKRLDCGPPPHPKAQPGIPASGDRWLTVQTQSLNAVLDRRRGLTFRSLALVADRRPPMVVNLMHGHFQDIALQADWYTGNAVFEALDGPKVTDLERTEVTASQDSHTHGKIVETTIPTRKGPVFKRLIFDADQPRVSIDYVFHWPDWGRGSLRAAHILLNPAAFDWSKLTLQTANGGPMPETFQIGVDGVDHGAAVSFQVSAATGLGATDGVVRVSDGARAFRIEIDRNVAPLLVMVQNKLTADGPFCRIMLSALEMDDTRKPEPGPAAPRHIRYALILEE